MPWYDTPLAALLGVRLPIVLAPMAGAPSTSRLAAAVSEDGAILVPENANSFEVTDEACDRLGVLVVSDLNRDLTHRVLASD